MDYLLNKENKENWIINLVVLNLIINGLPSKHKFVYFEGVSESRVLNLIINGLPSKHKIITMI